MGTASVFLPFLAMLPAQIPLNNMLYDLSEVAIPLEHVLAALVVAYLGIVEAAKRMFYRHLATKPK